MKYKDVFNRFNYESFKKVFLSHSSKEKKQFLIETGIGKTIRDDKIRKLYKKFIDGKIDEESIELFLKRYFLQDTLYGRASLRERQGGFVIKFLEFMKIPHVKGMVEDVNKFKKLKAKNFIKFLKKHSLEDGESFMFYVYLHYLACEYHIKNIDNFISEDSIFESFRKEKL